jgi:hypothetical protein
MIGSILRIGSAMSIVCSDDQAVLRRRCWSSAVTPEADGPSGGNAMYVFALPQ